jgi:hypothetical protein
MLQLVCEDHWVIPVQLDARLHEALDVQLDRALRGERSHLLVRKLSACIASSLAECLDVDLQLPTVSQINYATDIARELGVALPGDALRFRGAITEFIERFVEPFRASRLRHAGKSNRDEE